MYLLSRERSSSQTSVPVAVIERMFMEWVIFERCINLLLSIGVVHQDRCMRVREKGSENDSSSCHASDCRLHIQLIFRLLGEPCRPANHERVANCIRIRAFTKKIIHQRANSAGVPSGWPVQCRSALSILLHAETARSNVSPGSKTKECDERVCCARAFVLMKVEA